MGDLVPPQHMYQEFILKMHWGGITNSKGLLIITVSVKLLSQMAVLISSHSFIPHQMLRRLALDPSFLGKIS